MKSLSQILENYVPAFTKLGEGEKTTNEDEEIEKLRNELIPFLRKREKQIKNYFVIFITLASLSVGFAILVWAAKEYFPYSDTLTRIASVFTIIGIAPLSFLFNVQNWIKDRNDARMLVKMVDSLNKDTFQSVLVVLATMLKK